MAERPLPPVDPPASHQSARGSYIAQADRGGTAQVIVNRYTLEPVPPRPVDPRELAAADDLLGALPLDVVPPPSVLPRGSRMPLRPNPLFVGREAELRELGTALARGRTAAVTGLGGVGKTQLASEFVHRYGPYFAGGVFWLSFADGGAVANEVAACGGVGHLDLRPDFAGLPLEDRVRAVLAAWAGPLPRLLVFDNCEEAALLDQWGPRTGGCRVLVTSRRATWPAALAVHPMPLGVLGRPDSVALLRHHLRGPAAAAAELTTIAHELGDLPLALHLAGSVLARYHDAITPAAYLERLRQPALQDLEGRWLRADEPSPTGHAQQLAATFTFSYQRLDAGDPTDALSLALLARAAHLAPGEPIPRDLLLATLALPADDPDAPYRTEDAVARLVNLGLLERGVAGALRLHRLLAVFVRARAADPGAQAAVERAVLETATQSSGDTELAPLLALQPYLRRVTDAASARGDEQAARLCAVLGDHLMRLGDYPGAKAYYERALAIRQDRLGDRHADTVAAMHAVGMVHKERGEYAEAQSYFERALAINEQVHGDRHADTVASLTNLIFVLKDQGSLREAQRYQERALAITRELRGEQHLDTAVSLNNLGLVHKDRGAYAEAQRYFQQALEISQAAYRARHPAAMDAQDAATVTVASLNNLAFVLKDQGWYSSAQPYFERALAINEQVHGDRHADTVASLTNLAFVSLDLARQPGDRTEGPPDRSAALRSGDEGPYDKPRRYLERALEIQERSLPEHHPRIADALNSLGELLARQGDHKGAQGYFERALAIRQQVLGEWHPETAQSLSNLGKVLAAQGADHEAKSYLERAVAAFERVPGPTHRSASAAQARSTLAEVEARIKYWSDYYMASIRG